MLNHNLDGAIDQAIKSKGLWLGQVALNGVGDLLERVKVLCFDCNFKGTSKSCSVGRRLYQSRRHLVDGRNDTHDSF